MSLKPTDMPYGLSPGDTIAAVLPSGPPDKSKFDAGVAWLRAQGFVVRMQEGASERKLRYLAGSPEARLAELSDAWRDPSVRAVYCGRGGYGAMHLLEGFDEVVATSPPKLLIGFSDVTALGCVLWRYGMPWLHAPLLTTVAAEPPETQAHLLALARGQGRGRELSGNATIVAGSARGRLIGGSLSLISALCGTRWFPNLNGAILFIEDVGERPYRLDRMWMQLQLSGALHKVAGVALGHLTQCDAPDHRGLEVMHELIAALGVPAVSGFQFGHEAPNFAMPFGAEATLDAVARRLTIEEDIAL